MSPMPEEQHVGWCFSSRTTEEKNGNGLRERTRRQVTKSLTGSKEDLRLY